MKHTKHFLALLSLAVLSGCADLPNAPSISGSTKLDGTVVLPVAQQAVVLELSSDVAIDSVRIGYEGTSIFQSTAGTTPFRVLVLSPSSALPERLPVRAYLRDPSGVVGVKILESSDAEGKLQAGGEVAPLQ